MKVVVDPRSGFCNGVERAVAVAERELKNGSGLFCLGEIVHNHEEVARLERLGLVTIGHDEFAGLHNCRVMIRAHGEPPETYRIAEKNNIELIDATCPVVARVQNIVRRGQEEMSEKEGQVVIFGKNKHAEVVGLTGQTEGRALVIENKDQLHGVDFSRPVHLFSQTTMSLEEFHEIAGSIGSEVEKACGNQDSYRISDTVCRQVSNRSEHLTSFAKGFDVIVFVSGVNSSNGRILFEKCREVRPESYLISAPDEVNPKWFGQAESVGVCGATSTPRWLMESVADHIGKICS